MKKDFHKLTHFITMMASVWKGLCGQSENYKTTKNIYFDVEIKWKKMDNLEMDTRVWEKQK